MDAYTQIIETTRVAYSNAATALQHTKPAYCSADERPAAVERWQKAEARYDFLSDVQGSWARQRLRALKAWQADPLSAVIHRTGPTAWLIVDGSGNTIATTAAATDADWLLLEHHNKTLAAAAQSLATRFPAIQTRLLAGAWLLLTGRIAHHPLDDADTGAHNYLVHSCSTPGRIYHVRIQHRGPWTCKVHADPNAAVTGTQCPDLAHQAPDAGFGRRCKHICAAMLMHGLPPLANGSLPTGHLPEHIESQFTPAGVLISYRGLPVWSPSPPDGDFYTSTLSGELLLSNAASIRREQDASCE